MKLKKVFVFVFLLVAFSFTVFAEIKVISPVEGNWSNKQMLIIDASDGADYFYSLNGADPTVAGFAYDGPVLIDLTGDVNVKISKGFYGNETKDISFFVKPEYPESDAERTFIYSFIDTGILNYFSGAEIRIPDTMLFSFEQNATSYIKGRTLKYSDYCSLSRFIPCTVTKGESKWRFVIKANPKTSGTFSRRDLPITVINWDEISFDNKDLIYKIDDEYWSLPKENVKIDRTKSHIIYWQSIAFEAGNPIEFIELPPKPELKKEVNKDGSVSFYLDGDESYSMSFVSRDASYQELFTELCADTFHGDYLAEKKKIAVYSDSFYQGTIDVEYEIDKRVAPVPEFFASQKGFYVHGKLELEVKSTKGAELFVAISNPLVVVGKEDFSNPNSEVFKNVYAEKFANAGSQQKIVLDAIDDVSTFYKVRAYSTYGDTESDIVEYSVIVDNYNYYFDSNADPSFADGTPEHPYTSFAQGFDVIKQFRSVNIYASGNLSFPEGKTEILFNCKITGLNDAVLVLPKNSSLIIKSSTLQISNCHVVSDNSEASKNVPSSILKIENGVLNISDCEFSALGAKNNTAIDANNSAVTLKDSVFSVTATTYASFVSANNTHVNVSACKVGVVGDTSVAFSVRGSDFAMSDSSVRLTGSIGRVAEFFGVNAKVTKNDCKGDLKKRSGSSGTIDYIYADKSSKLEDSENYVIGF